MRSLGFPCCCDAVGGCNICGFADNSLYEVDVTITGVVNPVGCPAPFACCICDDLNSTFTLVPVSSDSCVWRYSLTGDITRGHCNYGAIELHLTADANDDVLVTVYATFTFVSTKLITWNNTIPSSNGTTDCTLNVVSASHVTSSGTCNASSSSVSISWTYVGP